MVWWIALILDSSFTLFILWAFSIPIYFLYETTRFTNFTKVVIGSVIGITLGVIFLPMGEKSLQMGEKSLQSGYELKWKYGPAVIEGKILTSGDTVYLPLAGGYLHAVDCETGKMKWKFKPEGLSQIMPVSELDNGLILCVGSSMPPPNLLGFKLIYAIDAQTGLIKWHEKTEYETIFASPTHDGRVFVLTYSNDLNEAQLGKPKILYLFNGRDGKLEGKLTKNWGCMPVPHGANIVCGINKGGRGDFVGYLDMLKNKVRWVLQLKAGTEGVEFFWLSGGMVVGGGMVCFVTYDATRSYLYNVSAQSGQKLREKVVSCPTGVII